MNTELLEILSEISGIEPEDINPEMTLREDLGFDSLDFVFLHEDILNTFNMELTDEQAEKIVTVQDLINIIPTQ
jgi:acyl carrier protein